MALPTSLSAAIASIFGSTGVVAASSWLIGISNRVTKLETKQEDLPQLIETRFDAVEHRLDRIERAMNGAFKHVE